MSKLIVTAFVTLDGVMQAPGGPNEDVDAGFEHGGWQVPYVDDDFMELIQGVFERTDHLLLGRKTYDIFAAHWPRVTDQNDPIAVKLNAMPKYVASRTRNSLEWHNSHLLKGEAAESVAQLKEQLDGVIMTQGSSDLIRTLQQHDLVDEYRLLVNPLILGTGKRLFSEGAAPSAWRLTESRPTSVGVQYCTYERAGKPEYGSFMLDEQE
ncbi:dihydrofolate reductase family protein [Streptomyces sp. Je 1-4]|uniref:dihydrofolate reductase family protein n=1 Tax=Streptomyces TaxID=1883 RepID=UPI0021DB3CF7|nr:MULTISPECIES: dihydrofolate reductase family protein [unclassified Streptomyces]UYB38006.1 dihydrofolate reductase family protein [Streptomyces sp. Je 1-4]UZQ33937.1 dihydrofolate reductase family protein [Streptomyces sp. Je 1-4] [Streptomyces sp. Je 1-4 4N24]UZQ41355.1 dihydrofolate reductase family protein [Streptomyces sp. Je 1-4] [Streptomyces sp. Je 1-4 4N24_ara]